MTARRTRSLARRLIGLTAATLFAVGGLTAGVGSAAHAAPVPETETLVLHDVTVTQLVARSSIGGIQFSLHPFGGTPTTVMTNQTLGTTLHVVLSSCGKVVTERTSTLRGYDAFIYVGFGADQRYYSPNPSALSDMIGDSIDYTLTVTKPGYDPYTYTGSTSDYATRPSCEDLAGDNAAGIAVQAWSDRIGALDATGGSTLTISDTRASGARISYVWTVTDQTTETSKASRAQATKSSKASKKSVGTVVARGLRTLRVKRAWVGKDLAVTVTVTKGTGKRTKALTKTLRYGTVA